ncbi:HAD family hydrolase [Rossellomorea sp. BNER]|uniref:HAD family hydrolase n=1 Tax=Rossellomorea sp. BNER TaxID=2962031 RepID=UPI003AF29BF5|nr:HAD family hydrolase [Rossellomorea sp. BNER]
MKAVIFDFDGLIIDTESLWFEVFRDVTLEYGGQLALSDFSSTIGTTSEVLYQHIENITNEKFDQTEIEKKTRERYELKKEELILREGVLDYIESASKTGLKIALATSSSRKWVEEFLEKFHLIKFFDVIRTKDDVKNVKPDPELYLQATKALGVDPSEVFVFEDSKNGLTAALAAGLKCVVVPNDVTKHLKFDGHAFILNSMSDISFDQVIERLSV